MKVTVVDNVPEPGPGGRRESALAEIVRLAISSAPKFVEVTDDSKDAVNKLYKAMIQYRIRHSDLGIQMRKQGERFYVWFEASGPHDEGRSVNAADGASAKVSRNTRTVSPRASGKSKQTVAANGHPSAGGGGLA